MRSTGERINRQKEQLLREELPLAGVTDPAVLAAIAKVDRAAFVPPFLRSRAYLDRPLPFGADEQYLYLIRKKADGLELSRLYPVRFVPLVA